MTQKITISAAAIIAIVALVFAPLAVVHAASFSIDTTRVSEGGTNDTPIQGDEDSDDVDVSDDGRYAVFESDATNLITGDTNGYDDIYFVDRQSHTIERISDAGTEASPVESDDASYDPKMSDDGQIIVFESDASNLVAGDANGNTDIFIFDRSMHTMERVMAGTSGSPVEPDGYASDASISGDGRYVAFYSDSTNLVAGDTNGYSDIFVFDRQSHTIERVSEGGTSGSPVQHTADECLDEDTSISDDGNYVVFSMCSDGDGLVAADTNGEGDVYVFERSTHTLSLASVAGTSGSPVYGNDRSDDAVISGNGQFIAFESEATNFDPLNTNTGDTDVYVFDRVNHVTQLVSKGGTSGSPVYSDNDSNDPSISDDGQFIAYEQDSDVLLAADTNGEQDVYVFDRINHEAERVSINSTTDPLIEGDDSADTPAISGNGSVVMYTAETDVMLSEDTNGVEDIYATDNVFVLEDNDGVDTSIEGAAPNSGDANNDGMPDAEQTGVTSLVNPVTANYSVIEAGACTANNTVSSSAESTAAPDSEHDFPVGLMTFTLTGCAVGGTETITQYHYGATYDLSTLVMRKFDGTTYTTVSGATFSTVTIDGQSVLKVVYQVTDGGPLDQDGVANGTIVDPAGPGTTLGTLAETGVPIAVFALVGTVLTGAVAALVYASRKRVIQIPVVFK